MKKDEVLKSAPFFESYVKNKVDDESRKAEIKVLRFFKFIVPVFALVPISYLTADLISGKPASIFYFILLAYLVVVIIYHRFCEYLLVKKNIDSYALRFINVFIEITTITIVILNMYSIYGGVAILSGPLVMVYMIMIVMTGFRFSFRLSLFAGMMAAAQHLILYAFMIREVPLELYDRLMDFGPSGIIQKSLYLVFAGVMSSNLALFAKSMIMKVASKSIENIEIKNTFGQFVSKEIRDFILSGKIDANGDEKEGVILFTDIGNFNEVLNGTKPSQVVSQLNEYFTEMVAIIASNKGVVNKFIGDAIMAVFGLTENDDNPEFSAVKCAVLMQKRLEKLNEKWQSETHFTFRMGIGVCSGCFVTGNVGSENRKEFTCMGDVVNTASRLEGVAKNYPNGIIISDKLNEKLGEISSFFSEEIGEIDLKGKSVKVRAFSVSVDSFINWINDRKLQKKVKKS